MRLSFIFLLGLASVACGSVTSASEPVQPPVEICRHSKRGTVAITNIGSVVAGASGTSVRVVTGNRSTVAAPDGNCVFSDTLPRRHRLDPDAADFLKRPDPLR